MIRRCRARPLLEARLVGASVAALLVLSVLSASRSVAWAAPGRDAAEGRKHAQRASHLAATGKCRQAVGEYDKAIAVLHDPTLLFNRGECHRKLGDVDAALEDYNQFLSDLPNAPNRAQVEERIAELRSSPPPTGNAATMATPGAAGVAPRVPGASAPLARPEPRQPVGAPAAPPPVARVDVAPRPAPEPAQATVLASPLESEMAGPSRTSASRGDSLSSRPWFWVALGAVVVGAAIGTYFVLGRDPTNIPRSDLGNYRF